MPSDWLYSGGQNNHAFGKDGKGNEAQTDDPRFP